MRVLYFSRDYSPHDHRFLSAIVRGGHEAHYLRLERGPRETESRPVPAGVQVIDWDLARSGFSWARIPRLTRGLRRVLDEVRPDLVHAGPIQSCAMLVALTGYAPLLTMSWGFDLMQDVHAGWQARLATRYTLKRSAFFTSDAEATRNVAIGFGMDPARTAVIPWGVDLTVFQPRLWPAQRPAMFTVLCNRAWEPRYGVDVLVRAFVEVLKSRGDVQLLLLGGGSQEGVIRRILANEAVGNVQWVGQVAQPELPRWYHKADLYVSPSHVDGASVSLMEAMACGLPALVSDIPGNREWVQDGANGWLFPDGDASVLCEGILRAVDLWPRLSLLGQAGRRIAEERADWRVNAGKLMDAYQRASQAH